MEESPHKKMIVNSSSSSTLNSVTSNIELSEIDANFIEKAFLQAKLALTEGEVPVGCVFTENNEIICEGRNSTNKRLTGEAHAEMKCIDEILLKFPNINWSNVALYVTVEPCIMCAAALKILGVKKIVFGCRNPRFGGMGTVIDAMEMTCKCEPPSVLADIRSEDAISLLKEFYAGTNPSAPEDKVKKKKVKGDKEGSESQL